MPVMYPLFWGPAKMVKLLTAIPEEFSFAIRNCIARNMYVYMYIQIYIRIHRCITLYHITLHNMSFHVSSVHYITLHFTLHYMHTYIQIYTYPCICIWIYDHIRKNGTNASSQFCQRLVATVKVN